MQINAHQSCDMQNDKPYVIGFDLGDFSVGMSAIQIDSEGLPTRILNSQSVIHDSGVDPSQRKYGTSRKKGVCKNGG